MGVKQLQKISDETIIGELIPSDSGTNKLSQNFVEDIPDIKAVIRVGFKNFIGLIPGIGQGIATVIDYREAKATRIREQEVNSCLSKIEKKLEKVEIKQEAVDYFEESLIFRFEEIMQKLLTNPGKGFDEVLAEFVANALANLSTRPETKDLILSTLLNLDSVDILVFKELDRHFLSNLSEAKTNTGVTRDSILTLLKDSGIDKAVINRSLQKLQSQYLIQPLNTNSASIQEVPSAKELYEGIRSPQFESPSGFLSTDFGRTFLTFLKLSK